MILTAESVSQVVTNSIAAGLLVFGGLAAFWRFLLQAPLGNKYGFEISPCRIRRLPDGRIAYCVCVTVENRSAAIQQIHGWWRRIVLPIDVGPEYDPDVQLTVSTDEEAIKRIGTEQGYAGYSLMPGEDLADQMVRIVAGDKQEICYVEYALKYKQWTWGFGAGIIRRRRFEYRSQIMTAPVEREDLDS